MAKKDSKQISKWSTMFWKDDWNQKVFSNDTERSFVNDMFIYFIIAQRMNQLYRVHDIQQR